MIMKKDKAKLVFEKLLRKSDLVKSDPRLGEYDDDLYFQQLQRDAIKSLHILPEVQKTERGFEIKGLDPDYYSPDG